LLAAAKLMEMWNIHCFHENCWPNPHTGSAKDQTVHISTTKSPTTKTQISMLMQIHPARQKCTANNKLAWNWVNHNPKPCVHLNQGHAKIKEQAQTTTKNGKVTTTDVMYFNFVTNRPGWTCEFTRQCPSQQPRAPQPKLKYPC